LNIEGSVRDGGLPVAESPQAPEDPPDIERLQEVAAQYGIEILPPQ
jgi:hypothetical protein